MLVNGERALAYVVTVDEVREIEGADNIQLALVGGWNLIVKRDEFKAGDKGVFFEIDSKLPADDERFSFLEKKGYKIKTMKLNKFGVYSQGLLLPLSDFPELGDIAVGTDLTKKLRVTYAEADDNQRKGTGGDPNAKYKLTELNPDATPRIEAGQTLTGAQLMQNGVQVKFPDKVSSVNIKLDKVQ